MSIWRSNIRDMPRAAQGTGFSQSLERGLAVLTAFTPDRPAFGISELASDLALTRSTTHRYVTTLAMLGFLEQDTGTRKYRLGLRVLDLGFSRSPESMSDLVSRLGPAVQATARQISSRVILCGVMNTNASDAAATLLLNGQPREVRAEPDTALLYVLRNHLGLKGTRFGCGLSLCGACMVLVDGQAVYSCDTPLWSVLDKNVTTVEGLGTGERPHPVTRALIEEQAAQCGYCMSGITVAAAELLSRNDDPSDAEVRAALDRNLCRCGAHNRVVRAVLAAAAEVRASRENAI
jgi:nicotinate dehydrogenase subunit A